MYRDPLAGPITMLPNIALTEWIHVKAAQFQLCSRPRLDEHVSTEHVLEITSHSTSEVGRDDRAHVI